MSSRSTPRRRKVVSTSHALDLLNNWNANNVTHEPKSSVPYRPRLSRRPKIDDVLSPQSDSIWEIPDEPDHDPSGASRRAPASEPVTPHRSVRLRTKLVQKTTPSRRVTRRVNLRVSDNDGEEGSDPERERERESGQRSDNSSGKEAEEAHTSPAQENQESSESDASYVDVVEDHGDNERPQAVLSSPHNATKPNPPSPLDSQKSEGSNENSDGSSDEPESEYGTARDHPLEQTDEPRLSLDDASSTHKQLRGSPAVVIINRVTDGRSSVSTVEELAHSLGSSGRSTLLEDIAQPSRVQAESESLVDEAEISEVEAESAGEDHTNVAVEDNLSVYVPTDDEDSVRDPPLRSGLFRYESDPEDLSTPPSKRRQTFNQQQASGEIGRSRRKSIVTSRPVDSLDSHEDRNEHLQRRHSSNDTEQYSQDISNDESDDESDEEAWLHHALKMAGQKNNWDALMVRAHRVQKNANPSMAEYFDDFADLTSTLKAKYEKIVNYLDARRGPPHAMVRECDELLNAIRSDGTTSVDYIVEHKDDEPDPGRPTSEETLDEFEVCLVSRMTGVLLACFEAYCKENGRFPKAYEHLHQVLDIFLRLCYKIYCVVNAGYVDSENLSHSLELPLRKLITALEKDLFKGRAPQPEPVSAMSIKHGRKWTDEEGCALLDGLQRYQGRDRYARILEHYGDRLRGRTIRGTRDKARQLHEKLLSTVVDPDVLQTEEGRQQWYWLLSVREE
ncbi:hypothetical protein BDV26DRAFT_263726 [Aspergillus bertholletiae]|uniref:Uncharacterized protein n=1 Tax=Aspergillus bertholletiae TaxID=1226010 RepID=A0A5N7B637_9EURO|nr:hypothetical protein BDV26DRAFT_263726 [Aspergillus bertholletiae]